MSDFTRAIMILCGVVSSFAMSAYVVLLTISPQGYLSDPASIPMAAGLPIGGYCGAFIAWAMCRLAFLKVSEKAPISLIGSTGCFGALGGWLLLILFMKLIGAEAD